VLSRAWDITMSLDGVVAGPDMGHDDRWGRNGMSLAEAGLRFAKLSAWTAKGRRSSRNDDDEIMGRERRGAPPAVSWVAGCRRRAPGTWRAGVGRRNVGGPVRGPEHALPHAGLRHDASTMSGALVLGDDVQS